MMFFSSDKCRIQHCIWFLGALNFGMIEELKLLTKKRSMKELIFFMDST